MSGVSLPPPPPPPPSPPPRRIAPPSWLDLRLVLGVVLVLASVLIGAKVVSGARATYATVSARHDLAAGTVLAADDLRLVQVQLPGRGHGVYLRRVDDAVGKQLTRAVAGGELLPARALARLEQRTTVTVPLASGSAPQLRKGQRIELWVSTAGCSSRVLLADVTVQAVRAGSGGSFGTAAGGQDVVISVAPPLAERVVSALAFEDVKLRAGVLLGPRPSGDQPLPDLAPCAHTGR
jgi:hypothetical protein